MRNANTHCGQSIQLCRIVAPAVASTGMMSAHAHQYSQPIENPAHLPSARSA